GPALRSAPVSDPGTGPRRREGGRAAGVPGGAVHLGRTARAAVPGSPRVARAARTPEHPLLPARDGRPGAPRDRPLASPQSRHDDPRGDGGPARGERVDGPDAGKRERAPLPPRGPARARAEQASPRAPSDARGGGGTPRALHHGAPHWHR